MTTRTRKYDIVLFGATGFTGKLAAHALVEGAEADVRLAIAGRNQQKLEALRNQLTKKTNRDIAMLLADSNDKTSLEAVCSQTAVVMTTAGPFLRLGLPLAEACAKSGTDYCDITGEVPFVRTLIDKNEAQAKATGARLVPCCGFDSIPSDIGVRLAYETAKKQGLSLSNVHFVLRQSKGGMSGGTLASIRMLAALARKDKQLRNWLMDAYCLVPPRATRGRGMDSPFQRGALYNKHLGCWTAPFIMDAINGRIVRRSSALIGGYGPSFSYTEGLATGRQGPGRAAAWALTGGMLLLGATMSISQFDPLFDRLLPQAGEGPSDKTRASGMYRIAIVAETEQSSGQSGPVIKVRVEGDRDPGYNDTAWMLTESALSLLHDKQSQGGVHTPSSAMFHTLLQGLERRGIRFSAVI